MILDIDNTIEEKIEAQARVSEAFLNYLHYRVVEWREESPLIFVNVNEVLYALNNDPIKISSLNETRTAYIDLDTEHYVLEGILFKMFSNDYVLQVNAIHDKHDPRYKQNQH